MTESPESTKTDYTKYPDADPYMVTLLKAQGKEPDMVMLNIIGRTMKQIAINRAREAGAPEKWIADIEKLNSATAYHVVDVCFGIPGVKSGQRIA